MKIKNLSIKNAKGLKSITINDLDSSKLNLLVAPNGFGKSSIAYLIDKVNSNRINTDRSFEYYSLDSKNSPYIKLVLDSGEQFEITKSKNEANKFFIFHVVNSKLVAKSKSFRTQNFTASMPSLSIPDITIIKNVVDTFKRNLKKVYSLYLEKYKHENNKILFTNLKNVKIDNVALFSNEKKILDILFEIQKIYKTNFKDCLSKIEIEVFKVNATQEESLNTLELFLNKKIKFAKDLRSLLDKLKNSILKLSLLECLSVIIQLVDIYSLQEIKEYIKFLQYKIAKEDLKDLINVACSSKFSKSKISLVVEKGDLKVKFPKYSLLSNGQRDIIKVLTEIFKITHRCVSKQNYLIVIDEVFDYLDFGNLISFQFYLCKALEYFKKENKNVFFLLMTHLDPIAFKQYSINKKLLNIIFLNNSQNYPMYSNVNHCLGCNLISTRNKSKNTDKKLYDLLSTSVFHYDSNLDLDISFVKKSIRLQNNLSIGNLRDFYKLIDEQFNLYVCSNTNNQENNNSQNIIDPFLVTLSVRLRIEKYLDDNYQKVTSKEEYKNLNETTQMLSFVQESIGDDILPNHFFLLASLFSDELHSSKFHERDMYYSLIAKLDNQLLKKIISLIKDYPLIS